MSTEIKKYEVTILGELYTLVSDQSDEHIVSATNKINEIIREISQKAPHLEQKKLAVLAALKIASRLVECEYELEAVKNKSQALLDTIDRELPASCIV